MSHEAIQNPRNKVGRYSGAGPGGISEVVPTERERERGLEPISLDRDRGWAAPALALTAILGAGLGAYLVKRAREPRTTADRIRNWAGLG